MGREIKRVPLNFNWPLGEVWGGYKNPFSVQSTQCPDCDGRGYTREYLKLEDRWYGKSPFKPEDRGSKPWLPTDPPVRRFAERNVSHSPSYYGSGEPAIQREAERLCKLFNAQWSHHLNADDVAALVKANRLHEFTHEWTDGKGWKPKKPAVFPTPEQVNEWSLSGFGHDSCNCWAVCKAEARRLGLPTTCKRCDGSGDIWPTPETKRRRDRWKPTEPPKGKGYQLWETVSEGSPISPVFATPEELADWLATPGNAKGVDVGTTYEQWLAFIQGPSWAPSFIVQNGSVQTGVQATTNP